MRKAELKLGAKQVQPAVAAHQHALQCDGQCPAKRPQDGFKTPALAYAACMSLVNVLALTSWSLTLQQVVHMLLQWLIMSINADCAPDFLTVGKDCNDGWC